MKQCPWQQFESDSDIYYDQYNSVMRLNSFKRMDAFPHIWAHGLQTWHFKITLYYCLQLLRVLRHPTNQTSTASAAHHWQWGGRVLGALLPVWRLTTTTPCGSKRKEGRIRTCPNDHTLLLTRFGLSRTSPDYSSTRPTQSRLNRIANITTSVRPAIVRVLLN